MVVPLITTDEMVYPLVSVAEALRRRKVNCVNPFTVLANVMVLLPEINATEGLISISKLLSRMSVSLGVSASICTALSCWPLEAMKALYMASLLQPLQPVFRSPLPQPAMPSGSGSIMVWACGMTPIWESIDPLNSRSTCACAAKEIPKTVATATVRMLGRRRNVFKQTPVGQRHKARHTECRR